MDEYEHLAELMDLLEEGFKNINKRLDNLEKKLNDINIQSDEYEYQKARSKLEKIYSEGIEGIKNTGITNTYSPPTNSIQGIVSPKYTNVITDESSRNVTWKSDHSSLIDKLKNAILK